MKLSETKRLQSRVDELVGLLGQEFPKQKIARALTAKACDLSMEAVGPMGAICMTEQASSLMAGHWGPDFIEMFIDRPL